MNAPLKTPPPLPASTAGYREKVRSFAAARRSFVAKDARRRIAALVLSLAFVVIVADVFAGLPAAARWLALGALILTAASLTARWWWRPVRALDEAAATRELERGFPSLGQRLRTVREVESSPATQRPAPALAGALVDDTRRRMAALDPHTLIPWEKLRGPLLACVAATGVFLALLAGWPEFRTGAARLALPGARLSYTKVTIENPRPTFTDRENPLIVAHLAGRPAAEAMLFLREEGGEWTAAKMARADSANRFDAVLTGRAKDFDYYVAAGDGRTEQRHMRCMVTPKIEKAAAELAFPEYTGLPPGHSDGGDVRAVEETKARVIFQLNHPLKTAGARRTDGLDLAVTVSGSQVIVEHTLERGEVVWQLSGRDADGLELAPASYKLIGLEDKLPEVQLIEPVKDVEATTVWEILARVKAKDDFGLAKTGIMLVVGDDMKLITSREFVEKDRHEATEMGTALLEEFPLKITDNLKIYAYATDHKPRDGARAVSNLRAIDIRQFKTRWALGKGEGMPMSGAQLRELSDLVREQRKVVSDIFVLKENGPAAGGDIGAVCDKIAAREDALAERAVKLKAEVEVLGTMNRDDLVLLDTAAQQMGDASKHLGSRLLRPAYRQADNALSSLLALRKLIMRILMQNKLPMPAESEDHGKNKSLTDLAAEAERLAGEERDVRGKVAPEPPPERELEAVRHQQEVAVTDAGELYAALVAHPEITELALQRMDEAEKTMQRADETIRNTAPQDAGPDLQSAEDKLLLLAAQLRALDEKNMAETMGKLAEMAAKAKQRMEQEKKDRDDAKGQDKQDQPGAKQAGSSGDGSPGGEKKDAEAKTAEAKDGEAKKDADAKAGADAKQGEKPGGDKDGKDAKDGAQAGAEKKPGAGGKKDGLGKVADQAATLDDVLKSLAARAGGKDGERLAELREQAKTDALAPDVRGLAGEKDDAKAGENAGGLAERFGKLADSLSGEQRRLQQSRIEQLAEALARTKEAEKNGGKAGEKPGDKAGGKAGEKPGDKAGEKGKGEKAGKDGQAGTQGQPKPGGQNGKGGPDEKGEAKNQRGGGDKGRANNGGTGHTDPNTRYLKDLERLDDDVVIRLLKPLTDDLKTGAFDTAHLKAVEDRLGKMIDEMLRANVASHRADRVPDEYGHLVDEYFRALSDDFGGEEWNPDEKKPDMK